MAGISDDVENLRVNRGDFINALEEVHPAFGVSEEELQQVIQNGIIHYNDNVKASNSIILFFSLIPNMLPTGAPSYWSIIRGTSSHFKAYTLG